TTSGEFRLAEYDVGYDGNIRFRIVKLEGGTAGSRTHRVNIDDFTVTEYMPPFDGARMRLAVDAEEVPSGQEYTYTFMPAAPGITRTIDVELTNTGQASLTGTLSLTGASVFSLAGDTSFNLGFRESATVTVRFSGSEPGVYT